MFKKHGFTLIELIMIIVILGILAAVAIPRFYDLSDDAEQAAEEGVVGGVRAGIQTFFAENRAWPGSLDLTDTDHSCNSTTPCFDNVLAQGGITADWSKVGDVYTYTPTGHAYTYDPASGEFTR